MKQLRRLDVPTADDAWSRAQRGSLRYVDLTEDEFRALERERPGQVVVEGDAALACRTRPGHVAEVHYAYPDRDAFVRLFPSMFEGLATAVSPDDAPLGLRLTLVDRPSRPYVEPVLRAQAFELSREWMVMKLPELPDAGAASEEVAPGFRLRPAEVEDAEAIARLEDAAFPTGAVTVAAVLEMLRSDERIWLLEETASGRAAGSLRLRREPPATGYVSVLAVRPDNQRRGLGEWLLRWSLAHFREQGLRRAALTVTLDNAPAIALYRKLGFTPGASGIDYRRPIDPDEVRQAREKQRGTLIKFGGWR